MNVTPTRTEPTMVRLLNRSGIDKGKRGAVNDLMTMFKDNDLFAYL